MRRLLEGGTLKENIIPCPRKDKRYAPEIVFF